LFYSDLLDDPDAILSGLKHFRHEGHEVLVFHVLDPREIDFAYSGDVRFKDLETNAEMPTQPWHLRKEYRELMSGFIEHLRRGCREHRIDYHVLNTSAVYSEALIQFLTSENAFAEWILLRISYSPVIKGRGIFLPHGLFCSMWIESDSMFVSINISMYYISYLYPRSKSHLNIHRGILLAIRYNTGYKNQ